MSTMEVI